MAKKEKSVVGHTGGREDQLGNVAGFWMGISSFASIVGLGLAIDAFSKYGQEWIGFVWLTAAVVTFAQAFLVLIFCATVADILRVLKKQAGLPFGGTVRMPKTGYAFTCSECGAWTWGGDKYCRKCKEEFTEENSS